MEKKEQEASSVTFYESDFTKREERAKIGFFEALAHLSFH